MNIYVMYICAYCNVTKAPLKSEGLWCPSFTTVLSSLSTLPGQDVVEKELKVKVKSLSCVWLFATLWAVARQAPPSWDFPGKNTGVGCHFLQGSSRPRNWTLVSHITGRLYPLSHQGIPTSKNWFQIWFQIANKLKKSELSIILLLF